MSPCFASVNISTIIQNQPFYLIFLYNIGCKDAIDAAFRAEKTCIELQRGLDVIMKRKDTATKQINKLEKEVKTKEDAIDTLRFERKKNEATIKEMLIHLKSQQAQLS